MIKLINENGLLNKTWQEIWNALENNEPAIIHLAGGFHIGFVVAMGEYDGTYLLYTSIDEEGHYEASEPDICPIFVSDIPPS